MPNHITQRIEIIGDIDKVSEMIEKFSTKVDPSLVKTFDGRLNCTKENGHGWFDTKTGVFQQRGHSDLLGIPDGFEIMINDGFEQFPDFEKIIPMPDAIKSTIGDSGINPGWYNWSVENWGTKWNSYCCKKIKLNIYEFQTAWSAVPDLIKKMADEFPKLKIIYTWADEDLGSNVGKIIFHNGKIDGGRYENNSIEANKLALSLNQVDYAELIDGEIVYKEDY